MIRTGRRALLRTAAAAGLTPLTACSDSDTTAPTTDPSRTTAPEESASSMTTTDATDPADPTNSATRVLLAFFSRAGENYYYGDRTDLEVGNTEVLAGMIATRTGCDLYEIEAADPYSDDYDATVQRNVEEQDADARPEIANPLPDLAGYDVVLLASPIWNVRPPMIMRTFAEALDFTGKRVHPAVTFAVSGSGTSVEEYAQACPGADLSAPLAVQGEEVADAGPDLDAWLAENGLT